MTISKSTKTVTIKYKHLIRDYTNMSLGSAINAFLTEYKAQL